MDLNTIHTIVSITPDRPWGIAIASYFYLTGISATNFIFASLYFVFRKDYFKNISFFALIVSFVFLLVAPMNLVDELTQAGRIMNFFLYGWENFLTSPMKWGVLLLMSYFSTMILELFLAYKMLFKKEEKYKNLVFYFGILGVVLALGIEFYTAYLIAILHSFILLNTPLMPPLFLASALLSGTGVLMILLGMYVVFFKKEKLNLELFAKLCKLLAFFALLDILLRIFWFSFLLVFNGEDKEIAQIFFAKEGFFIVFVDMGLCLLLPLIIGFSRLINSLFFGFLAAFLSAFGAFLFRYTLVIGGQSFPKMSTSFLEYKIDFLSDNFISLFSNLGLLIALFCFILAIFDKNLMLQKGE